MSGATTINPYSSARASFDNVQAFTASCGVDLDDFSAGKYSPGIICRFPDVEDWDGVSVWSRVEDHGDWYRGFIVRTIGSGIEVLACAGTM